MDPYIISALVFLSIVCSIQFHFLSRYHRRVINISKAVVYARSTLGNVSDLAESLVTPQHIWNMADKGLNEITHEITRNDVP